MPHVFHSAKFERLQAEPLRAGLTADWSGLAPPGFISKFSIKARVQEGSGSPSGDQRRVLCR